MIVPYPEDEYLSWLGKASYTVSFFEWSILGDLPHIAGLPEEFAIDKLVGKSTGNIANALKEKAALAKISDPKIRTWFKAGAAHLEAISVARNSILHARPATSPDGKQRLNRWDPGRGEAFLIETQRLIDLIEDIDTRLRDMSDRRLI